MFICYSSPHGHAQKWQKKLFMTSWTITTVNSLFFEKHTYLKLPGKKKNVLISLKNYQPISLVSNM